MKKAGYQIKVCFLHENNVSYASTMWAQIWLFSDEAEATCRFLLLLLLLLLWLHATHLHRSEHVWLLLLLLVRHLSTHGHVRLTAKHISHVHCHIRLLLLLSWEHHIIVTHLVVLDLLWLLSLPSSAEPSKTTHSAHPTMILRLKPSLGLSLKPFKGCLILLLKKCHLLLKLF